jgi:hypothetical protein
MAARCSSTARSPRRVRTTPRLAAGAAYPLFYDSLFASLRQLLADAAIGAEQRKDGLRPHDGTLRGMDGSSADELEQAGVIMPMLFRRLIEFFRDSARTLAEFTAWLAEEKPEQVVDLEG